MMLCQSRSCWSVKLILATLASIAINSCSYAQAFVPTTERRLVSTRPLPSVHPHTSPMLSIVALSVRRTALRRQPLYAGAGGFEWEDPTEVFDQGVENPYKSTDFDMAVDSDAGLNIDPARLLSPRMNGSNLYFVGMMGSGKSAVGNIVAKRMGTYTFLDTDEIIEKAAGLTIPDIFASEGEEAFRAIEAQVLDSVHPYVRCVISTGGGIVCRMENWSKLQTGLVVWLDVTPEVIHDRIRGTDRPLLQTSDPLQTLRDLLAVRVDQYNNADVRIAVTADMDEIAVADAVIRELHDFIDTHPPAWKLAKQKAKEEGLDWVK